MNARTRFWWDVSHRIAFLARRIVDVTLTVLGPVKAALKASVRHLAAELESLGIPFSSISPGPLTTRAASFPNLP